AGVLIASMLGDKYFLDRQTADVFREGGTFHVLVISGLHITFIGALILLLARQFTNRRKLQAIVAVSALWFYGIAVGGETPVIRACVMFTIMMFGYGFYRTSTLLNALGASALVLLVWRPSDLFDPSFQLTFVSIAAIVALGLPIVEKLKMIGVWTPTAAHPFPPNVSNWLQRFCETVYWRDAAWEIERGRHIWSAQLLKFPLLRRIDTFGARHLLTFAFEGVVISLAVQVCLLPLLVFYFHRVSIASVVLNLWVGAVLAVESITAVIAFGLGSLSHVLAFPFETLTEMFNWLLVTVPSHLTESGWASIRVPIYSGPFRLLYLLYLVPVVASSVMIMRWDPFDLVKKKGMPKLIIALVSILILSSLIIFHPFSTSRPDMSLHIDFLDVGQGDAAFITFPNGETMLVDAGGRTDYGADGDNTFEPDIPRIGEAVVSEVLWERGLSHVDHIVATHADADHIQGLVDVSKNFSIRAAYFARLQTDHELVELLSLWQERRIPITRVGSGDIFDIGGARIEILNPPHGSPGDMSSNNGSVVMRVVFGETEILLTGDVEAPAEEVFLARGYPLTSDVIKVPHHGSRTSSTEGFVRAVAPAFAIISVGRRSMYGHPHSEVVERWKVAGANVLTTGEGGMISVSTDGKTLAIKQFRSE
ncbi:MAG TPA: ComEC/Rec2 family competence protein, partial [Pyrinomonadaceae bacterium]|nr:ComEC/Rec2 family competence protein [Pyrinomonadaceae bacterium]